MLKIRLRRMGSRHKPFYRVVVSESRRAPAASALEEVGYYDPRKTPATLSMNVDRVDYWTNHGAQPSDTVRRLVEQARAEIPDTETTAPEADADETAEAAAAETEAENAAETTSEDDAAEVESEEPAAAAGTEEGSRDDGSASPNTGDGDGESAQADAPEGGQAS